jgi:hypothetical protein
LTVELVPKPLDVPDAQRGEGAFRPRYEDISQDGRLSCRALTNVLGATFWEKVLPGHPYGRPLAKAGIVPILARVIVTSGGGPIGFGTPVSARGSFAMVRALDAKGRARFRLDMSADASGIVGSTHPPRPANAGETIAIGRVYAEHVLTRLFAAPSERRVDALPEGVNVDGDGPWHEPEASASAPIGAHFVDDETEDPTLTAFGIGHTDANQHVNSLVYPLLLEEAALRHVARPAASSFCAHFELAFRKPFFAGERARIRLRAYERAGRFGVIARFVDAAGDARTFGRIELTA